ncbi:MAG TPA: hypothetical protein VI032_00005, partial [Burkholderiaceae bacterium]
MFALLSKIGVFVATGYSAALAIIALQTLFPSVFNNTQIVRVSTEWLGRLLFFGFHLTLIAIIWSFSYAFGASSKVRTN